MKACWGRQESNGALVVAPYIEEREGEGSLILPSSPPGMDGVGSGQFFNDDRCERHYFRHAGCHARLWGFGSCRRNHHRHHCRSPSPVDVSDSGTHAWPRDFSL